MDHGIQNNENSESNEFDQNEEFRRDDIVDEPTPRNP